MSAGNRKTETGTGETFETKRNEIQLKIDRMGRKIKTYEKTGNSFTSTISDLINLASQAGRVFAKSDNLELKHLLLKFVFKEMILTEGELTYELNFPFSEFEKAYFYEKRNKFLQGSQNEENQGFEDNKTDENAKSFGPKIAFKNQRVASKNATLLQSGWIRRAVSECVYNVYFNVFCNLFAYPLAFSK